jgi:hypothetical protein
MWSCVRSHFLSLFLPPQQRRPEEARAEAAASKRARPHSRHPRPSAGRARSLRRKGVFERRSPGRGYHLIAYSEALINVLQLGAQNPRWAGNGHFNPPAKIIFATLPHPTITKMNRLLSASWAIADATRWSIETTVSCSFRQYVYVAVVYGEGHEKPFSLHRRSIPPRRNHKGRLINS